MCRQVSGKKKMTTTIVIPAKNGQKPENGPPAKELGKQTSDNGAESGSQNSRDRGKANVLATLGRGD